MKHATGVVNGLIFEFARDNKERDKLCTKVDSLCEAILPILRNPNASSEAVGRIPPAPLPPASCEICPLRLVPQIRLYLPEA